MKSERINIVIAEVSGAADKWTIVKRGLFYCPEAKGYTSDIEKAWILPLVEAKKHEYIHGAHDDVTLFQAPCPNYHGDLNSCAEFEKTLSDEDYSGKYIHHLDDIMRRDGNITRCVSATAPQRCEAFLRTLGLWEEEE